MNLLRQGSLLGERPHYVAPVDGTHASTLSELLGKLEAGARAIDLTGLRQYFDRQPDGIRTCFERTKRLPAGCDLYRDDAGLRVRERVLPEPSGSLLPVLERCVAQILASARSPAVALSGGLDSALVLALVRRVAGRPVPVLTLATCLPGYCELEQTLATAHALGGNDVDVIEAEPEQMVHVLPAAIAACETPLFNLHPVSKLLLARAAAQRGHDAVITGDGADQVFAGSDPRNYLPIVGAMMRAAGVSLLSPFFDEHVISWARRNGADPQKAALRTAAATILPPEITWRPKCSRFAPDFNLNEYRHPQLEEHLAPKLGLRPAGDEPGPEQTLWATSAILLLHLGGTC